jgi:hypothetical protein
MKKLKTPNKPQLKRSRVPARAPVFTPNADVHARASTCARRLRVRIFAIRLLLICGSAMCPYVFAVFWLYVGYGVPLVYVYAFACFLETCESLAYVEFLTWRSDFHACSTLMIILLLVLVH